MMRCNFGAGDALPYRDKICCDSGAGSDGDGKITSSSDPAPGTGMSFGSSSSHRSHSEGDTGNSKSDEFGRRDSGFGSDA